MMFALKNRVSFPHFWDHVIDPDFDDVGGGIAVSFSRDGQPFVEMAEIETTAYRHILPMCGEVVPFVAYSAPVRPPPPEPPIDPPTLAEILPAHRQLSISDGFRAQMTGLDPDVEVSVMWDCKEFIIWVACAAVGKMSHIRRPESSKPEDIVAEINAWVTRHKARATG